jgi:O-antigen/teichoic acid export membrane protein
VFSAANSFLNRLLTSRLGRDTVGSMSLKLANVALTFFTTVLLARLLGPSEYGVYAFVYATVSLLSVPSEFGLPTLVVRETARGMLNQDYSSVAGIWRWTGLATTYISLGLVGLSLVGIWLFREPLASQRLTTFLCALALVPLISLGDLRGAALSGLNHVVAGQLPEFLLRPGIFMLLVTVGALMGNISFNAPLAMGFYVSSAAAAFGGGAWLLWRATPLSVRKALPRFESRAWLMSALPLAFIGGMQIVNQQASILLQGFFLPNAAIGIFRIASQVALLASFGLMTINTVLTPRFATLYAQGDMKKLQRLVTVSARVILIFNLALTAGFIFWGKLFLRIAFGSDYQVAYVPLIILLIGQLINSGAGSVGLLLNMSGFERETARGTLVAAILNVTLNLLLIPFWGINGSAAATSISLIIWNILLWQAVRKQLGINSLAFS